MLLQARDANAVAAYLATAFQQRLSVDQILALFTTDGASAEGATVAILGTDHWVCVCHRLHNVVRHALEESEAAVVYTRLNTLAVKLGSTSTLSKAFERVQCEITQEDKPLHLLQSVPTRWTSEHAAGTRVLKKQVWKALCRPSREGLFDTFLPRETFSKTAKMELKALQSILDGFASVPTELQSESVPTLPLVASRIHRLTQPVQPRPAEVPVAAARLRACLYNQLQKRFDGLFDRPNFALCASALSPRFACLPWVSASTRDGVWHMPAEEAMKIVGPKDDPVSPDIVKQSLAVVREKLELLSREYLADPAPECEKDKQDR